MAIIMGNGCIEAIYGLMGWKGLTNKIFGSERDIYTHTIALPLCTLMGSISLEPYFLSGLISYAFLGIRYDRFIIIVYTSCQFAVQFLCTLLMSSYDLSYIQMNAINDKTAVVQIIISNSIMTCILTEFIMIGPNV